MLPYQNPNLPIEARLDDLIARMTLEELIAQTDQYSADGFVHRDADGDATRVETEKLEAVFGGHPHQSKIGSEEPIFDSFSLKGEAFGETSYLVR